MKKGVIMIFANLVTDFSRMGYVRTEIEDICDRYSLNCVIDKNGVSDEGITFIVSGGTFGAALLYLIIA